ncbi:hypothetical protein QR680_004304 [Steinernema hermaphroditum]|uniref:Uncharacterized protein n=1 Tax=Steinernema hermaphroditum TaxID=289476 RepID=A0AA39LTT0_9BILA|nr:hypothetical protein QR680_004304 [Steinernema hermaphroditum]
MENGLLLTIETSENNSIARKETPDSKYELEQLEKDSEDDKESDTCASPEKKPNLSEKTGKENDRQTLARDVEWYEDMRRNNEEAERRDDRIRASVQIPPSIEKLYRESERSGEKSTASKEKELHEAVKQAAQLKKNNAKLEEVTELLDVRKEFFDARLEKNQKGTRI